MDKVDLAAGYAVALHERVMVMQEYAGRVAGAIGFLLEDEDLGSEALGIIQMHEAAVEISKVIGNYNDKMAAIIKRAAANPVAIETPPAENENEANRDEEASLDQHDAGDEPETAPNTPHNTP